MFLDFMQKFDSQYPPKIRFTVKSSEMGVLSPIHDFVYRSNLEIWDRAIAVGNGSLFQGISQVLTDIVDVGYLPQDGSEVVWLNPEKPGEMKFFIRMAVEFVMGESADGRLPTPQFVGLQNTYNGSVEAIQLHLVTGARLHSRIEKPVRQVPPEHEFKTFEINVLTLIELADEHLQKLAKKEGPANPSKKRTRLSNFIGQLRKIVQTMGYNKRESTDLSMLRLQVTEIANAIAEEIGHGNL